VWGASSGLTTMRPTERAEAPDVAQQLFFLEDPFGILGECDEEHVLLRRELHCLAGRVTTREARSISRSRTVNRGCRGPFERRRTARIRASSSS
jgi:hypothetical protein